MSLSSEIDSIKTLILSAFPNHCIYMEEAWVGFKRPCFYLEEIKNRLENQNRQYSLNKRRWQLILFADKFKDLIPAKDIIENLFMKDMLIPLLNSDRFIRVIDIEENIKGKEKAVYFSLQTTSPNVRQFPKVEKIREVHHNERMRKDGE